MITTTLQRNAPYVLLAAGFLVAAGPLVLDYYGKAFVFSLLLYITLAQAWNLFSGFTGYVSFGHGLFFGVGAYTFALSQLRLGLPWWLNLLAAGFVAVVVGLALSRLVLVGRMGIAYFAVFMLAMNEIIRTIVANSSTLGSTYGFTLEAMPSQLFGYYGVLVLAVGISGAVLWVQRSRFGPALRALQDDEQAAEVAGINSTGLKLATLAVSAGTIGVLGGLVAWNWRYVDPFIAFGLPMTFNMVLMAMVGGIGTTLGPIIGAAFVRVLEEWLGVYATGLHTILLGVLLVLVVLYLPTGLVRLVDVPRNLLGRRRHRGASRSPDRGRR